MSESLELSLSNAIHEWADAQKALDDAVQRYLDCTIALGCNMYSHTESTSTLDALSKTWMSQLPVPDKYSRLDRAQVHLNQIRNSFLPINKLPHEILLKIFWFTAFNTFHAQYNTPIPFSYQQDDYQDLLVITHVCSYWRTVLLNAPIFWSRFVLDPHYSLARECERAAAYSSRANGIPQSLTFYEHLSRRPFHLRHFNTMARIIDSRLDNLRQLTLLNFECVQLVTRTIRYWRDNGKPGVLRSLTIQLEPSIMHPRQIYTGNDADERQMELMLGPIRTLSLRGITFAWDSPIYWNLVALRIGNIHPMTSPTIHELLGILAACPLLHTLRLYGMAIRPCDSTTLTSVYFTELENLNLALLSPQDVGLLLPRIFSQGRDLSLRLAFQSWSVKSFNAVYPFLARTSVTRLFIEQCEGPESGSVIGRCLSALPNLNTLILDLSLRPGDSCLAALTCPDQSNTRRLPRCPQLQSLFLVTGSVSVEAVQEVVETHPLLGKLRFSACYVEPFEEELGYWLKMSGKDVKFDLRLDMAGLFDWYHIMN